VSPATQVLLEAHLAAIRRWHQCKQSADQRGEMSVLVAQGQMRSTAAVFAASDAADRFARGVEG
jgi:hypothetical protein